ncbi:MAG TPA: hypothetical protein VGS10_11490 [Terracidiphilus sp.]|nr:hypothetical protein [Terracidiphilus sp.]
MARTRTVADLEVMLRANTAQLQKSMDDVKRKIGEVGTQTRASMEETRGSIMLLGEQIGVRMPRELSRFVAGIKGVNTAMAAAFNTIAVIALIDVVVKAGEKVSEFVKKNQEAADKNREAWRSIAQPMQSANDALQAANDRLRDSIAKLENKPTNGLALAIDDAIVEAGKLGDKLDQDISKIAETLKGQQVGMLDQIIGKAGDSDITTHAKDLKNTLASINDAEHERLETLRAQHATQKQINDASDAFNKQRQTAISNEHSWAQQQITNANTLQKTGVQVVYGGGTTGGGGTQATMMVDQSARLNALKNYSGGLADMSGYAYLMQDNSSLQQTQAKLQAGKDAQAAANDADQKRLKALQDTLAQKEEILGKSAAFEVAYWDSVIGQLHKGTAAYQEAQQHQHEAFMQMEANFRKMEQEANKHVTDSGSATYGYPSYKDLAPTRADVMLAEAQQRAAQIANENQRRYQEASDRIGVRTGALSPHQAAVNAEQFNAQMFQAQFIALTQQLSHLFADDPEYAAKRQQIQNQIDQLVGGYKTQHLEDQYADEMSTARGKVIDSLNQMAIAFTDTGKQLSEVFARSLSTVNDSIMEMLTTPGSVRRGQHLWSHTGAAIASGAGRTALEHAEGSVMGLLGFGGSKADGKSRGTAIWTRSADLAEKAGSSVVSGVTGLASHLGGFGSFVAGLFGGGHALGGDVLGGVPITVGELGTETFVPPSNGTIIPHSAARPMQSIAIDARGANDPAAVTAAVHRAMSAYLPHIGSMSMAAQRDNARRSPASRQG